MALETQVNLRNLLLAHNFLKLIQTRLEQLWTKWHASALEFVIEWPFRIEGISSTRLLSWVLALSVVQVLDCAFLDDNDRRDYTRSSRLFFWQLLMTIAHVLDEIIPYFHYDLYNWTSPKTAVNVLYSREGAKASWLLVNLMACAVLNGIIARLIQHRPLLLVATLALANASIAYFVKSVIVDLTHFETLTANYSLLVLTHPLFIYAGHAAFGFNAFLCAVYKTEPARRELCAKLIDLISRVSIALLGLGATLGALCNKNKGARMWAWDHIECNALLFSTLNLLTIHLNKLGGRPRDSILGYQLLACPLSIVMMYAIHHDLIPTSHGIEGPIGRGGILAWVVCVISAVFVLALIKSVCECVLAVNARTAAPPYGLALACALFVIVIMALLAFAIFASSRLGVISAITVIMCVWFGVSVLTFDLCHNKHSFGLAVLITAILIHVLANRRHALIESIAVGYYGVSALKHLFRLLYNPHANSIADVCHLSITCALTCASLSQIGTTRVRVSLCHALAAVRTAKAGLFGSNAAIGVVSPRSSYPVKGYVAIFRTPKLPALSSALFNVSSIVLLLTHKSMDWLTRAITLKPCVWAMLCWQRALNACAQVKRVLTRQDKKQTEQNVLTFKQEDDLQAIGLMLTIIAALVTLIQIECVL